MDLLTTLLIVVFFFLMGAAIVGLIWYLSGVSQRTRNGSKTAVPDDPDLDEIARLKRHTQSQELVVEMDGKNFYAAHELSPAQQRRLTFTSNVLTKWLAEPPPEPPTEGEPALTDTKRIPEGTMYFETGLDEPRENYFPPFVVDPEEQPKPVSTDLPDMVGGILNPAPQPTTAFKSIATQINDVLQAHLAGTALESRGITLQDAPDRGVMVTLDGNQYNSVMDVPDEGVRNIIRDAVVEWETMK